MSCSDRAALLKDGKCVSDCGAGFYGQDGVCYGKVDPKKTGDVALDAVIDGAGFSS